MNVRNVWTPAAAGLAAALAVVPADAQPENWQGGWGWGWGHMIFGSVTMLLFWGLLIVAIVLVVRWLGGPAQHQDPPAAPSRALAILEERFAKGEIDRDEFEERKRLLSK